MSKAANSDAAILSNELSTLIDDRVSAIWRHVRDNAHSLEREVHCWRIRSLVQMAVAECDDRIQRLESTLRSERQKLRDARSEVKRLERVLQRERSVT